MSTYPARHFSSPHTISHDIPSEFETRKGKNKVDNTQSTGQPKSDQNQNKIISMPSYIEKVDTIPKYEITYNGNTLGNFVKMYELKKKVSYTSYT
jgi:hypothetical protein